MNCTKHLIGAALLTLGMTLSAQNLKPVTDDTPEVPVPVKQETVAKAEVQPKSADPSVAQVDAKIAKKQEVAENNKAPEKPVKYKQSKLIALRFLYSHVISFCFLERGRQPIFRRSNISVTASLFRILRIFSVFSLRDSWRVLKMSPVAL